MESCIARPKLAACDGNARLPFATALTDLRTLYARNFTTIIDWPSVTRESETCMTGTREPGRES